MASLETNGLMTGTADQDFFLDAVDSLSLLNVFSCSGHMTQKFYHNGTLIASTSAPLKDYVISEPIVEFSFGALGDAGSTSKCLKIAIPAGFSGGVIVTEVSGKCGGAGLIAGGNVSGVKWTISGAGHATIMTKVDTDSIYP